MKKILSALSLVMVCAGPLLAQSDSLLIAKNRHTLDSLNDIFSHEDSLSIFVLIDSLLKLEPVKETSQLAVRIGYNSNIVSDSRTFNIDKFGLSGGASYYHKSGAYLDATQYWSQEYSPSLYLTIASGGYFFQAKKTYSFLAEYSHYFYNQPKDSVVYIPYSNNIGIINYFEFKPLIVRLDYYLYFGDKVGHRIMPNVGVNLVKRKWAGFNRFSFYPNASVMYGSEQITEYAFYPNPIIRYRLGLPLTYETYHTEFGVMNYSFSAPLTLSKKDWIFLLNYTYNIPRSLPGEDDTLQSGGYVSFSITRYFGF